MKKTIAICLLICLLLLTACGQSKPEPTTAAVQMPNPVKEVSAEELAPATGIALAPPEGAQEVRYFTIAGEPTLAQMTFQLNGKDYTYRAVPTKMDATALSGVYFTKAEESAAQVAYLDAAVMHDSTNYVIYWYDVVPGISYSLTAADVTVDDLVSTANAVFIPAQGEA